MFCPFYWKVLLSMPHDSNKAKQQVCSVNQAGQINDVRHRTCLCFPFVFGIWQQNLISEQKEHRMIVTTGSWLQFWIFQANPKEYQIPDNLETGDSIDWLVTRFAGQYREGDIVYLWIAGDDPGIYGWFVISGEVFEKSEGVSRIPIRFQGKLPDRIMKRELLRIPRILDGLTILRNPTGTNFRVTAQEAREINSLIGKQITTPPPNPDDIPDPRDIDCRYLKASYVLDYRFDSDVKKIIATCLEFAKGHSQVFFPSLLIGACFIALSQSFKNKRLQKSSPEMIRALDIERIVEKIKFSSEIGSLPAGNLQIELTTDLLVKQNVLKILAQARRIAIKTKRREQIELRHMIGAILQGTTNSFYKFVKEELLSASESDLSQIKKQFAEIIEKYWPEDDNSQWIKTINERIENNPPQTLPLLLTRIDSDTAGGTTRDLLKIDDEAKAFAKTMCARDADPPLAIGLFGEWGSGKTFFMRRIEYHAEKLSQYNADIKSGYSGVFCQKVAQIWFNAWNYQDSSLWANLASHIFTGLYHELKRLNAKTADTQYQNLLNELDRFRLGENRMMELYESINKLKDEKVKFTEESKKIEKELVELEKKASQKDEPKIFHSFKQSFLEEIKEYEGDINTFLKTRGMDQDIDSIAEDFNKFNALIQQFRRNKPWQSFRWFLSVLSRSRKIVLLVTVISLVALFSAVYFFQQPPQSGITIVSIGGIMTTVLSSIGWALVRVRKVSDRLSSLFANYEKRKEKKDSESQQIKQNIESKKLELAEVNTKISKNREAMTKEKKEKIKLDADYGGLSNETFANFIFSRLDCPEYEKKMGLLHLIRRDFSRLNDLLRQQKDENLPTLDRIILYIDDLDRCNKNVVVEVLQAVHLLLAFPLFMVVVGVDARWLGRSLKEHYTFLTHETDNDTRNDSIDSTASTHDYLEKIFQIPFWLKSMDKKLAGDMIKSLLTVQEQFHGQDERDNEASEAKNNENLFEETEDQENNYVEKSSVDEIPDEDLISTRSLEIGKTELEYIQKLGSIVGRSPRTVKRFINLYRILKAGNDKARSDDFTESGGEFKIPSLLLAIICGFPDSADEVLSHFNRSSEALTIKEFFADFDMLSLSTNVRKLVSELKSLESEIGGLKMKSIRDWIPHTIRFSYRDWRKRIH